MKIATHKSPARPGISFPVLELSRARLIFRRQQPVIGAISASSCFWRALTFSLRSLLSRPQGAGRPPVFHEHRWQIPFHLFWHEQR